MSTTRSDIGADPPSHARLLTVDEVAGQMRISPAMAWRLVGSGQLRSIKVGKLRRVPSAAVDEFIEAALAAGAA